MSCEWRGTLIPKSALIQGETMSHALSTLMESLSIYCHSHSLDPLALSLDQSHVVRDWHESSGETHRTLRSAGCQAGIGRRQTGFVQEKPRMNAWRKYPVIYEINAWVWLGELSRTQRVGVVRCIDRLKVSRLSVTVIAAVVNFFTTDAFVTFPATTLSTYSPSIFRMALLPMSCRVYSNLG